MSSSTLAPSLISEELRNGLLINIGVSGALGLIFNLTLASVLIRMIRKGNSHGDIKLCAYVVFTDVLVSFMLIIRAIFGKYPYNIWKEHPYWCRFDVGFTGQLLVYSGYSLGIMSIERFFLICFNIKVSVLVWFSLIALTWTAQFALVWVALSDGLQVLTRTEVQCGAIPIRGGYYAYVLAIFLLFFSFFCVITSYCSISIVKFRQCLNQINLNIPKEQVYTEFRTVLAKSIVNIALYIIVYSPKVYVALYELTTGQKRTIVMDIVSNGLILYSVIVNAFILFYMNQQVRNSFIQLLRDIRSSIF
jgi:hypothetical protein